MTCGRLEEQKNHKMLINAFELVVKEHKRAKLLIYGEGSLRNELEELIENKGLSNNIKLCGNSDNIPEVLSKAEIFVLSSDYEGMPNALMEALAVGVPSISTDCPCGGPSMLIQDKESGDLIEPGNYMELSLALLNLLGNNNLQDKYSYKSKKEAQRYRPSIIFKSWRKYMETIIS